MPPAHFLNAPTYRRRHHGGSGAHRRRDRGDHQKLLISLLVLCKTEDVSMSSVLFYCQTLSLRASPQTGVAIRIPSLSPSVGVGVPDDPPLTAAPPLIPCRAAPMCAAADHHRTFKTCHCEPVRTLVWQSVLSPRTPQLSPFRFQLSTIYFPPITSMSNPPCSTK